MQALGVKMWVTEGAHRTKRQHSSIPKQGRPGRFRLCATQTSAASAWGCEDPKVPQSGNENNGNHKKPRQTKAKWEQDEDSYSALAMSQEQALMLQQRRILEMISLKGRMPVSCFLRSSINNLSLYHTTYYNGEKKQLISHTNSTQCTLSADPVAKMYSLKALKDRQFTWTRIRTSTVSNQHQITTTCRLLDSAKPTLLTNKTNHFM